MISKIFDIDLKFMCFLTIYNVFYTLWIKKHVWPRNGTINYDILIITDFSNSNKYFLCTTKDNKFWDTFVSIEI